MVSNGNGIISNGMDGQPISHTSAENEACSPKGTTELRLERGNGTILRGWTTIPARLTTPPTLSSARHSSAQNAPEGLTWGVVDRARSSPDIPGTTPVLAQY